MEGERHQMGGEDGGAGEQDPVSGFPELTFEEARVLGCLIEKEATTPEYYPLTLNALASACNQKSNRDPVTAFDERTVVAALDGLRAKRYAVQIAVAGARVPKFKHSLDVVLGPLSEAERGIVCVLLLRGAQTVGEIRTRSERIHTFPDLGRVEATLSDLISRERGPLVVMLPPGAVKRVKTFAHLLCGEVDGASTASRPVAAHVPEPASASSTMAARSPVPDQWREEIEDTIAALKQEIAELREEIDSLKQNLGV
jgi:uncharacterized protein YceH (UPF0502 family)